MTDATAKCPRVNDIDRARAREYALLASLLTRSPDAGLLARLATVRGDASPIGMAHLSLAEAAVRATEASVAREFSALFAGLGEGALLPYASHYLAGTLYGRPLARLRATLRGLGIETSPTRFEPEDHAGFLCEVMAALAGGRISSSEDAQRGFFDRHFAPWMRCFFADLEHAEAADFYAAVGVIGRTLIEIETTAFALPD